MNIFHKIEELNLPKGSYVIVGGGVLVALGLLEWDEDIDIAVSPEIFEDFLKQGWQKKEWRGKPLLTRDVYEIGVGFAKWDLKELLSDALWIREIPFISLEKILEWKKDTARSKDLEHIALIEKYLVHKYENS